MLELVPITLKEANAFVEQHHRHHKPVVGHKFSIAASDGEKIVGVAIVGRPVSRYLDNGLTIDAETQEIIESVKGRSFSDKVRNMANEYLRLKTKAIL